MVYAVTWASFVDFWIMRELGQEDSIMRNYDVMKYAGRGAFALMFGVQRIGIPVRHVDEAPNYIPEVMARLQAIGFKELNPDQVRVRLIGWYTWDRIRKGDIQQWFMAEHIRSARA